jgi:hypothetical protein
VAVVRGLGAECMFGWSGKYGVKIYRDGTVVSRVPKDEGRVGLQIRLDLPHEIGDLVSEDGLVPMDWQDLTSRSEPPQVGDRVRVMEIRVENMRLVYVRLERLP